MPHINDDIDELMRDAAENYPLKVNNADWETVARLLSEPGKDNQPPVIVFKQAETNNRYKYLLLLLLIPFALVIAHYTGLTGHGNGLAGEKNSGVTPGNSKKGDVTIGNNSAPAGTGKSPDAAAAQSGTNNIDDKPAKAALAGIQSNAKMSVSQTAGIISRQPNEVAGREPLKLSDLRTLEHPGMSVDVAVPVNGGKSAPGVQKGNNEIAANTPANNETALNSGNTANMPGDVIAPKAGAVGQPPATNPAPAAKPNDGGEMVTVKKPKRWYVGVLVAPDYTTVKYQPDSKVGFDFGGLVGYSVAKNLDAEIGVSIEKKYYQSKGEYFDSKLNWLDGSGMGKLLSISGYSNLTEIPLSLKYNFKKSSDGNFFVAAGMVSDIVHEENYDYTFDKNGYIYARDRATKIGTTTVFSNVTLSGGYESSLGGLCNFRIEPYYRIPVRGIGLGNLPITSFGLNIGITKKIK